MHYTKHVLKKKFQFMKMIQEEMNMAKAERSGSCADSRR